MFRIFFVAAGASCLGACSHGAFPGAAAPAWSSTGPQAGAFRFDWRLSGDPAVAPMQVFDDGNSIWLQFAPRQALPAIFGVRGNGEHALPYVRREPYVVVSGDWQALRFRGGRLAARAEREGGEPVAAAAQEKAFAAETVAAETPVAAPLAGVGALAAGGPLRSSRQEAGLFASASASTLAAGIASHLATPSATSAVAASTAATSHAESASHSTATLTPTEPALTAATLYRAAPPDTTLRGVLARWADRSGWTFGPQHWAVDVDIPLSASAEFPGDFKSAVRQLLAATELAEKPLQPCFYGNQVLRVVPLAQSCSRTATPQGGGA